MKYKPIVIINGQPRSIFLEIFFKSLKKNFKSPIILISSLSLIREYSKHFNLKNKINLIDQNNINLKKINNKKINLIDINYKSSNDPKQKDKNSRDFINKSFEIGLNIIKSRLTNKFINGPISKNKFLNKKFLGITEFIAKKSNSKKIAMLIYNKELSVCPLTTHLPLKDVPKQITKKNICEKVLLINSFYKKYFKIKPKMAILGLNPHCESIRNYNEDDRIVKPTIKYLKKLNFKVSGPYPADTIFMKQNRKKFDVIIGMYHDQVLTPLKTIYEYDAINITLGLPFLRISPDHGPNEIMIGKNSSNPKSLINSINFLDQN